MITLYICIIRWIFLYSPNRVCIFFTSVLVQSEAAEAEMNPPLFPDVLLHQTVKEEDEKSWNTKRRDVRVAKAPVDDTVFLWTSRVICPWKRLCSAGANQPRAFLRQTEIIHESTVRVVDPGTGRCETVASFSLLWLFSSDLCMWQQMFSERLLNKLTQWNAHNGLHTNVDTVPCCALWCFHFTRSCQLWRSDHYSNHHKKLKSFLIPDWTA